jgi:hypothetical protein
MHEFVLFFPTRHHDLSHALRDLRMILYAMLFAIVQPSIYIHAIFPMPSFSQNPSFFLACGYLSRVEFFAFRLFVPWAVCFDGCVVCCALRLVFLWRSHVLAGRYWLFVLSFRILPRSSFCFRKFSVSRSWTPLNACLSCPAAVYCPRVSVTAPFPPTPVKVPSSRFTFLFPFLAISLSHPPPSSFPRQSIPDPPPTTQNKSKLDSPTGSYFSILSGRCARGRIRVL